MATLPIKKNVANAEPTKKVATGTDPEAPGTKNPITDEAKSSFATFARVLAINSI